MDCCDFEIEFEEHFAKVAYTGDYNDLANKLSAGEHIAIDGNNVISAEGLATPEEVDEKIAEERVEVDRKLASKVDKEEGKGLSSNDFTDEEKASVEESAKDIEAMKAGFDEMSKEVAKKTEKRLLSYSNGHLYDGDTLLTFDMLHAMLMDKPDFVVLVYNGFAYHPNGVSNEQIVFSATYPVNGLDVNHRITMLGNGAVTQVDATDENIINKATAITDLNKSSDIKYPSVKAAADYVDAKDNALHAEISAVGEKADAIAFDTVQNTKRISNIEALLDGHETTFVTDSDAKYIKDVPSNSGTYGALLSIGGKSVKSKNLLNPSLQTTTNKGVTCTRNADGTYTLSGTATDVNASFYLIPTGKFLTDGVTYRLVGCPSGGETSSGWIYRITITNNSYSKAVYDVGNGVTFTYTDEYARIYIDIKAGTTTNLTFKPMVTTDLSATYDDYEPYYEGLRHGAVDDVVSHGANLVDLAKYVGLNGQETKVFNDDGSVTLTPRYQTGYPAYLLTGILPSGTYTISNYGSSRSIYVQIGNSSDYSHAVAVNGSYTFEYDGKSYLRILSSAIVAGESETIRFILAKSNVAMDYKPYHVPIHNPQPQALLSLPCYGMGVGDAYNEVDYEKKTYVQSVGEVDLGDVPFEKRAGVEGIFQAPFTTYGASVPSNNSTVANIMCARYSTDFWYKGGAGASATDKEIALNIGTLYIHDSNFADTESFKTAMQGVKLVYELATPRTYDITDILKGFDNLIETEPNGTLEFHNASEMAIDVPSKVEWMVTL